MGYILEKLHLKEGMTLLDIGCGWGFLLIEAAKKYKVKGTGITLSREQHAEFRKRIKEEGLQDMLDVKLMDYRDLPKDRPTTASSPSAWLSMWDGKITSFSTTASATS